MLSMKLELTWFERRWHGARPHIRDIFYLSMSACLSRFNCQARVNRLAFRNRFVTNASQLKKVNSSEVESKLREQKFCACFPARRRNVLDSCSAEEPDRFLFAETYDQTFSPCLRRRVRLSLYQPRSVFSYARSHGCWETRRRFHEFYFQLRTGVALARPRVQC